MNGNRARVFITHENGSLDYTPAEQFGDITFLTRDDISPVKGSLANDELVAKLKAQLRSFDFYNDFLLPSGSPAVSGLAFAILGGRTRDVAGLPLKILRWSNRDHKYQPLCVTLP